MSLGTGLLAKLGDESLDAGVLRREAMIGTRSCQIAMAFRPSANAASMISR
jgi:hypothetical protein